MNVDKLMKALDDESNESLLNFTSKKIHDLNKQIINELNINKKSEKELLDKLKEYKYVDEISDLRYGTYLRWINIETPNKLYLTKGAIFCNVKVTNEGVYLVCKNYGYKMTHFQMSMDKNLIFQKLTDQELILLSALDHLSTNNT